MNIDQSIHRMAFREAETLGLAQALIAKKRQELELRVQRQKVAEGTAASGSAIRRSLEDMQQQSEQLLRDSGGHIDRSA